MYSISTSHYKVSTIHIHQRNSMDPWEEVAVRLGARDQLEQKGREFYHIFAQLSQLQAPNNTQPDRTARENRRLLEENESLIRRLNSQTLQMERMESEMAELKMALKSQEAKNAKLTAKVASTQSEIAEKNRQIEIINDENLISQIQHNVLGDQVKSLKKENDELVRRWVERVGKEAEDMGIK